MKIYQRRGKGGTQTSGSVEGGRRRSRRQCRRERRGRGSSRFIYMEREGGKEGERGKGFVEKRRGKEGKTE